MTASNLDPSAAQVPGASHPSIKGYSQPLRMAALTCSLIGLQFTWGVEMTYFTPFLLHLGLQKSQTAIVWLAPPLSGFIVQPVIGIVSDSATWKLGRRRPYMLVGSCVVAMCLLTLAWAAELTRLVLRNEAQAQSVTIALAVFCIYALDFGINVVQATSRSLIVDVLPMTQQQLGSAWAGRMLGLGHLLGYFIGTLDLLKLFGTSFGETQFQQVCVIASCLLLSSVGLTCWCVKERVVLPNNTSPTSWFRVIGSIFEIALDLPKKIRAICWITFWCWIGWSPFHIYVTTWVGETYYQKDEGTLKELQNSVDRVGAISRKGAVALFLFSTISFAGSILWPWLVKTPSNDDGQQTRRTVRGYLARPNSSWIKRPDLTTAWAVSQVFFSASMILAPFSASYHFAISIVALCGIPWAMYGWAPLALLGEEINKLNNVASHGAYVGVGQEDINEMEAFPVGQEPPTHLRQASQTDTSIHESTGPSAGVYLGIWNIFATIPQFIATLIAMTVFAIFEPGKSFASGEVSVNDAHRTSGTAICLAIGAMCSLVAAVLTFQLCKI